MTQTVKTNLKLLFGWKLADSTTMTQKFSSSEYYVWMPFGFQTVKTTWNCFFIQNLQFRWESKIASSS